MTEEKRIAVSLKHPDRPDPSEVSQSILREYTPVHLTDEVYPTNTDRAYTPVHITDEDTPVKVTVSKVSVKPTDNVSTPKTSVKVTVSKVSVKSTDNVSDDKSNTSVASYIEVLFPILFLGLVVILIIVLLAYLPADTVSDVSTPSDTSTTSDMISDIFDIALSLYTDTPLSFIFPLAFISIGLSFICRIFRNLRL